MEYNWEDKVVLVVEDVKINYVLIKKQLRKTGAKVVWVKNGLESVEYVKDKNEVDLILMDVRMPIMDGIEATKAIKLENPDIPIIIQTACVIGNDYDDIEESGCDDYLFKPIISTVLYEKIALQFTLDKKK